MPLEMPLEVDRQAPVLAKRQVLIEAPHERVWALLTDIGSWPEWQRGVSHVSIDGPIEPGTSFRWKAGGFSITSTLREVIVPSRIAWAGKAIGLRALHAWHLRSMAGGTLVETAESFNGPLTRLLKPLMQRMLDRAIDEGLEDLKREAEAPIG